MERDYVERLNALAAALPDEVRVIGLLGSTDRPEAAALAADLAAAIAGHRSGHTILASLEEAPSALDHEVGVEGGPGLSAVLRGGNSLAEVAASGRVRGFIYLPAGIDPIAPARLLASRAWAKLSSSALGRGATLLLFLPGDVPRRELAGRLDGVVGLGGPRDAAAAEVPAPLLGYLAPPGPPAQEHERSGIFPGSGSVSSAIRRDPGQGRRRTTRRPGEVTRTGGASRDRAPKDRRATERPEREGDRRRLLAGTVLLLAGGALAAAVFATFGSGDGEPFLRQNDSLWSAPVESRPDGPEPDSAAEADTTARR